MLKEYFILIQTLWNRKVRHFLFSIFSIWLRPIWCCFGRSFLVKRLNVLNDLRKLFGAVYSIELLGFCDAFPGRIVVLYLGKNWVLPNWVSIFKVRLNFNLLYFHFFKWVPSIYTFLSQSQSSLKFFWTLLLDPLINRFL